MAKKENTDDSPLGFTQYQQSHASAGLFVPTQLAWTLDFEKQRALVAEIARDRACAEELRWRNRPLTLVEKELARARTEPRQAEVAPQAVEVPAQQRHLRRAVYGPSEVSALRRSASFTHDPEDQERIRMIASELEKRGSIRDIANVATVDAWRALRSAQPHFGDVIDFAREQVALAEENKSPLQIPPLLLLGPPGVGKSHFAQAMARAFGTEASTLHFDTGITNSALLGLDRKWANTRHGLLFERLCLAGEYANPIVVLEELDKAQITKSDNPVAPLHTLLEPSTNGRVTDLSLGFSFDASLVIWIATANDASLIPQTLLSRFKEFHIKFPSPEEAIQVADAVVAATVAAFAPPGFEAAKRNVSVWLAHCTAREIQQAVRAALARAVADKRSSLKRTDFSKEALGDEGPEAPRLH